MPHAVVTGTNRGIGLELVRQLAARGFAVTAGCRRPERADALAGIARATGRVAILPLEVADEAAIADFAARVRAAGTPVDLLVNNAGILLDEQGLGSVTRDALLRSFAVNAVAPLLLVQQLRPAFAASGARVLNISSGMASMANGLVSTYVNYAYAASKAALNRLGISLATELRPAGVAVYSFEPGWVKTDMAKGGGDYTPAEAVANILRVLDGLALGDSGGYFNWRGERHPW